MDTTPRDASPRPVDARQAVRLLDRLTGMHLPDAAALLAEAGLPVFPCRAGQKRPLTRHGLLDATTDRDQVAAWWRRWPAANVGLPTGRASGVVVLDVDVRTSGSGFPTFTALTRQGLAAGWAGLVFTPSGGLHAYYPAGGSVRSWQVADRHVDFRGDGGYVVVPPSRQHRPDGTTVRYRVARIGDHDLRPLDADRIRDLLLPRPRSTADPSPPERRNGQSGSRGADADRLAAWVAARGEGERNRGLFWAACRLAETGATPAQIQAVLGPPAEHAGLPAPEITATVRSASRTTRRTPGSSARFEDAPPLRAAPARNSDPPPRLSR
jgi:hypothetical protein